MSTLDTCAAVVVRKFVSHGGCRRADRYAVLRQYHLELTRLYWLDRSTSGRLRRTIEFRLPAILLRPHATRTTAPLGSFSVRLGASYWSGTLGRSRMRRAVAYPPKNGGNAGVGRTPRHLDKTAT